MDLQKKRIRRDNYNTPLHDAVKDRDLAKVEELINSGADKEAMNFEGQTALHLAVRHKCLQIVELLLSKGALLEAKDGRGYTPLHQAVKIGSLDCVRVLIAAGANVNAEAYKHTPLLLSVKCKTLHVMFYLLQHGAKVSIESRYYWNNTALHYACFFYSHRKSNAVKLLLHHNPDLSIKDTGGIAPIDFPIVKQYVTALTVIGMRDDICLDESYQSACLEEWEKIKKDELLSLVFLKWKNPYYYCCDVEIVSYIRGITNSSTVWREFPIYAWTLRWVFATGRIRAILLNSASRTLTKHMLAPLAIHLPCLVVIQILEYLGNEDLKRLCPQLLEQDGSDGYH